MSVRSGSKVSAAAHLTPRGAELRKFGLLHFCCPAARCPTTIQTIPEDMRPDRAVECFPTAACEPHWAAFSMRDRIVPSMAWPRPISVMTSRSADEGRPLMFHSASSVPT